MTKSKWNTPIPGSSALVLILFLLLVCVPIGLVALGVPQSPQSRQPRSERSSAGERASQPSTPSSTDTWRRYLDPAWAGQFAVEKHLLSPSTSRFVGVPTTNVRENGLVVVTGEVDATNAYGGTIREQWTVEFRPEYDGAKWVPRYKLVQIGDRILVEQHLSP